MCTPFDEKSVDLIEELNVEICKIGRSGLLHISMQRYLSITNASNNIVIYSIHGTSCNVDGWALVRRFRSCSAMDWPLLERVAERSLRENRSLHDRCMQRQRTLHHPRFAPNIPHAFSIQCKANKMYYVACSVHGTTRNASHATASRRTVLHRT
jgi:hypothetical protein